jgi:hypothetical protein
MDNRINEIRRKISALRAEMADIGATIRDLINHDQDCTEASYRLMTMRAEVTALVGQWKAAGGGERLPTFPARVSGNHRPVAHLKHREHGVAARPPLR